MNYDETRSKFASDEEMARALCGTVTQLEHEVEVMGRIADLAQALRQKAEAKVFLFLNPIPKQYKEHA
jgi:ferritin